MTWFIIGLLVGGCLAGAAAWFVASTRARSASTASIAEAEGTVRELRAQVQKADEDFGKLRGALEVERESRVRAQTQLQEAAKSIEEQKKLLEDAKTRLADTFKALSSDALKDNSEAFARRADELMKPLRERLKEYEDHVRELEKARKEAYGGLKDQLEGLGKTQQRLEKETHSLSTALRNPQARGAWGEMVLRRVVELAGMTSHVDFTEQVSTEGGALRPDMIVRLPGGRQVVVDSKAPIDDYRRAAEAETEDERRRLMDLHARRIREHMSALSRKGYWEQFADAAEFVVMFIPGESFFGAAVERDPTLIEDGMKNRVVLATPTTLIALLHAVAYGWRQEQFAENAQVVSELGRQLYDRLRVFSSHLADVGQHLGRATRAYNEAVASAESRLFVTARRFTELGVTAGQEIPLLEPVDTAPREMILPENADDAPPGLPPEQAAPDA
jgi:DNA recombination protein RmuC